MTPKDRLERRLERRMRWDLRRAFWYGFFHPWNTPEKRLTYAQNSLRKTEEWYAKIKSEGQ